MNPLIEWLVDDWGMAWRRSLVNRRRLNKGQQRALRWQMRLGRAVKSLLLVLPFILLFGLAATRDQSLTRGLLFLWGTVQALLLVAHVALALRYKVSYGWALHHRCACILVGLAAQGDTYRKAFLAACALTIALLTLTVNG